jgi:hypothetical protein
VLHASLLALTLALPAASQPTWVELTAFAQLQAQTLTAPPLASGVPSPGGRSLGGDATLGITVFARPLRDDDAAPSLQAFLQRAPRVRVEGGGGAATIEYPVYILQTQTPNSPLLTYQASLGGGHVRAAADGYVGRWVYLAAELGVGFQRWQQRDTGLSVGAFNPGTQLNPGPFSRLSDDELTLSVSAAAGFRWRDLQVAAGWGVTPYRLGGEDTQVRFWGGAFVSAEAVVRRFVELHARVEVLDGGAAAEAAATLWLRRRFGLELGADGGHGGLVDSPSTFSRAGGHAGVTWWLTPRWAAALRYAPAWQQTTPVAGLGTAIPSFAFVSHVVSLGFSERPAPLRR